MAALSFNEVAQRMASATRTIEKGQSKLLLATGCTAEEESTTSLPPSDQTTRSVKVDDGGAQATMADDTSTPPYPTEGNRKADPTKPLLIKDRDAKAVYDALGQWTRPVPGPKAKIQAALDDTFAAYHTTGARPVPPHPAPGSGISACRDRHVDITVNIPGEMPNRVFTLLPGTIAAVLLASGAPNEVAFMCRKFFVAMNHFEADKSTKETAGTTMAISNGRLFAEGSNMNYACGVNTPAVWLPTPRWVRLPPVLQLWSGHGSWYAKTTRGLYAWGHNGQMYQNAAKMGVRFDHQYVKYPVFIDIAQTGFTPEVIDVHVFDECTLIRTPSGWIFSGERDPFRSAGGVLDANSPTHAADDSVDEPLLYKDSDLAPAWAHADSWHAIGPMGLVAVHGPKVSMFGVVSDAMQDDYSDSDEDIDDNGWEEPERPPLSVEIPHGKSVVKIIGEDRRLFILCDDKTCYVIGHNSQGSLGLEDFQDTSVRVPIVLPFPVDDVIHKNNQTVFVSEGKVLVCGSNTYGQLSHTRDENSDSETDSPTTDSDSDSESTNLFGSTTSSSVVVDYLSDVVSPTPLDFPSVDPPDGVVMSGEVLFVRTVGGDWFSRGERDFGMLGSGPAHGLSGDIAPELAALGWSRVIIDSAESILCSSDFGIFFVGKEDIRACGANESGQLGVATDSKVVFTPQRVIRLTDYLPSPTPMVKVR